MQVEYSILYDKNILVLIEMHNFIENEADASRVFGIIQ